MVMTDVLEPDDDEEDFRNLPEGLWDRLRAEPTHAPEYLALAAVERWGEHAREFARRVRAEYPEASGAELAEMVKSRHATLARMEGAAAGVPGAFVPIAGAIVSVVPDLAALAWIQSRMVVQIAAVYGHDTTDQDMAAELLVLQGFYNTTEMARIAVAKAGQRIAKRLAMNYLKGGTLVLVRQLFRYVGIKFSRAGLLRAIPLLAIPLSAGVNELATRSLANRAIKFYDLRPRGKS